MLKSTLRKLIFTFTSTTILLLTSSSSKPVDNNIIFLHIPKSGGVTVSSILMNEYNHSEVNDFRNSQTKLFAYGFHYSLYETERLLDTSNFKLITFMRNPIERVLSEHRYCMEKHQGNPTILVSHKLPPEGDPLQTASNVACKMLSGLDDSDPTITPEMHLELAKQNLREKFYFIGITEKMSESFSLLYSLLDRDEPHEIPHFNTTQKNHEFPQQIIYEVTQNNWADIELYDFALTLYREQKKKILSTTQKRQKLHPIKFLSQSEFTFDKKLTGFGWGIREFCETTNKVYRWAVESNCTGVDFHLNANTEYSLETTVLIQPLLAGQFVILINDTPIDVRYDIPAIFDQNQYTWVKFSGIIPRTLVKEGEVTRVVYKMTLPDDPFLRQFYEKDNLQCSISDNYTKGKFACQRINIKTQPAP